MHSSSILAAIIAPLTALAANGRVNFYWDAHCQDYAEPQYPTPASGPGAGHVVGGPDGAKSMLWVSATSDCGSVNLFFCKDSECSAHDAAVIRECKHFSNGVWAEYWESC